ncbi:MAG: rhodanese-like domain-containing protein [Defluviicoccus sp.]|nr:rhodanese-like domain-containing protein [Defluviicoccus sp.]MDE0386165.1 rhodanese-like domain-containing protein [Defluviicoccus sp.]
MATALFAGSAPLCADVIRIDSAKLQQLLANREVVVDIRTPEEWRQTGVIEGSHLITFFDADGNHDVLRWMRKLMPIAISDQPVAIVGDGRGRSASVSRYLHEKIGYWRVYDLHKGIGEWIAEKRPLKPYP